MGWNVYSVMLNKETRNFGGIEWVVDGKNGRATYPGILRKEEARRLYQAGKSFSTTEQAMAFILKNQHE